MARTIKAAPQVEIDVMELKQVSHTYNLVGDTPFFCNRMAAKAKRELLLPHGPMSKTQKATKLKHAPYAEYRDSPYLRVADGGETLFQMMGSAPKMSIASAALRMPTSASKTEMKQLVRSPAEFISLWGIPKLDMSIVRMAGISRTPDVRTRAKIDRWAMRVTLVWAEPMLNATKVTQLLISAGFICGLGDWRVEKGGEYGAFRLAEDDDKELLDIMAEGGFLAQQEALKNPVCANSGSEELMAWYLEELGRRGINPEDEKPEDITDDDPTPGEFQFAAGDETLLAPRAVTNPLPQGNGEDFHG